MSPGEIPTSHPQCPHQESNLGGLFRKQELSPLSYRGMLKHRANDPDRTGNLPGTNRTLYLLSFVGKLEDVTTQRPAEAAARHAATRPLRVRASSKSHRRDSNPRPHPYQGCALPSELQRQTRCSVR
jgi:hypothetical protein